MNQEEYNGWKNRETWATNLWIENDEGLYNEARELTKNALKGYNPNVVNDLAETLKNWLETLLDFRAYRDEFGSDMPEGLQLMRDDIGSLYRVDWREIAEYAIEAETEEVNA